MVLFENKEQKLLNVLKFTGSPFKRFVSTGEIEEDFGLVRSRQEFVQTIIKIIDENENFLLPIIGDVGNGKTHLYWALKHRLHNYNTVYISLEKVYKKFYYRTYSEFIENIRKYSQAWLYAFTKQLCDEWGASERTFGFFHLADIDKVRKIAFEKWAPKFEKKAALMDAINVITAHQLEPYKKVEAERWLLGEVMNVRELARLNLMHDLREKNNSFTMLKILIENSNKGNILFIDDFEKVVPFMKQVEEDEAEEEVFDRSWLYGKKPAPENYSVEKTLDKILKLREIQDIKIIITVKSSDLFEEIKKKIKEKNSKVLEMLKEPLVLPNFIEKDIYPFYKKYLEYFFASINYSEYLSDFSNSYYPLSEKVLKYIYTQAKGNPREIIKFLIKIFNEIASSNETLEDIIKKYH